jgi:hypothetical protein
MSMSVVVLLDDSLYLGGDQDFTESKGAALPELVGRVTGE